LLCKKLRYYEKKAEESTTALCNGCREEMQKFHEETLERIGVKVCQLLGVAADAPHIFINHDPRGYALKVKDAWLRASDKVLYRDWGGYGILAPDFSEN